MVVGNQSSPRQNIFSQVQKIPFTYNQRPCCTQDFQPNISAGVRRYLHHEQSKFRRESRRSNQSKLPRNCRCLHCLASSASLEPSRSPKPESLHSCFMKSNETPKLYPRVVLVKDRPRNSCSVAVTCSDAFFHTKSNLRDKPQLRMSKEHYTRSLPKQVSPNVRTLHVGRPTARDGGRPCPSPLPSQRC